jgi:hypothetical protein
MSFAVGMRQLLYQEETAAHFHQSS